MIQKKEIVIWSILGLLILNMISGLFEHTTYYAGIILIFLTCTSFILIGGYTLFRPKDDKQQVPLVLAISCGIAFSLSVFAFSSKIWNHYNYVAWWYESANIFVLTYLIYYVVRNRKAAETSTFKFHRGLLIRSSILLIILLLVMALPYEVRNIYLNRNHKIFYNRGLSEMFYLKSLDLNENKQYKEALIYVNKSLEADSIGWPNDSSGKYKILQVQYQSYSGLMNEYVNKGENEKALQLYPLIRKPIHLCYGDSSFEQAKVLTLLGRANQNLSFFERADSSYDSSLQIYLHYYGYKNLYYAVTLKHLGNSYFDQNYYSDAISIFKSVIHILENDTTIYSMNGSPEDGKIGITNLIALSKADIGHAFSIKGVYDSADVYFDKAFEIESFVNHQEYPSALTNYAFHQMNKGDLMQSRATMQKALNTTRDKFGELSYNYLRVLSGLNQLNTTLSNYTEAEKGCLNALSIVTQLNAKEDDYYASLLLEYATVKKRQGYYDKAKELMEKALLCTDPKTLQYADILESLSGLYADLTEFHQAFDFGREASQLAQVYFESNTNSYLTKYIRNEAYTHYILGSNKQAESLYKRCYSIDTINETSDKLSFAGTLNGLALVKTRNKTFKIADTLYNASLDLYKNHTGENNTDYAIVLYNKAYLKMDEGKLQEANELLNTSQRILIKILGNKHDKVADNYLALGKLKVKEKKYKEALSYFNQANSIYKLKFKNTHQKCIEAQFLIDNYQNK